MQVEKKSECQSLTKFGENADQINPELKALLDKIAKKNGFNTYVLLVKKIATNGNNFLGVLTEVTVNDAPNNKDLHLFIKSIITNAEEIKMFSISDAYFREVYFYLEITKLFENLQADAHIPFDEQYHFVKSYSESNTDHIIMENMVKKGYTTWNRFDVISFEFAEKAIKLLAKFHALGFVVHEKKPKYFENKNMPLKFPFKFEEEFLQFYLNCASNVLEYLEGDARNKFEIAMTPLFDKCKEYVMDEKSTLTLCHGDYRPNNILITSAEREITDMVPIDYQFIYYGSPLLDLIYFIFGATDREFRRKHLDYLKNLYYDTMKQFLKYFDMDVEKYYPREEYETLFKERLDYGLFVGVWYLLGNLTPEDSPIDITVVQSSNVTFVKNDLAKKRIQELFDDFIEWGYL